MPEDPVPPLRPDNEYVDIPAHVQELFQRLGTMIRDSGVSTHDAVTAIGLTFGTLVYGVDKIMGTEAAEQACDRLDEVVCSAWDFCKEHVDEDQPGIPSVH